MSYEEMFELFKGGVITEEEWRTYCFKRLLLVLEENIEVFKRLKDM